MRIMNERNIDERSNIFDIMGISGEMTKEEYDDLVSRHYRYNETKDLELEFVVDDNEYEVMLEYQPSVKGGSQTINLGKNAGNCIVFSHTGNEGIIPHFHVFQINHGKRRPLKCAIMFTANAFFNHKERPDILSSKQMKILAEHLKLKVKGTDKNKWKVMTEKWNECFPNNKTDTDVKSMPDYTTKTLTYEEYKKQNN